MTYTFTQIDEKTINLSITFDDGSVFTDKMQNVPTDSKESLDAFVAEYARAYQAGKDIEKAKEISADVAELSGEVQTITVE